QNSCYYPPQVEIVNPLLTSNEYDCRPKRKRAMSVNRYQHSPRPPCSRVFSPGRDHKAPAVTWRLREPYLSVNSWERSFITDEPMKARMTVSRMRKLSTRAFLNFTLRTAI